MKKEVLFLYLAGFSDWEGAYLAPTLRAGLAQDGSGTDYTPKTLSLTTDHVCSMGGMTIQTDYTLTTMPATYAALIMVGGTGWQSAEAQLAAPLIERALAQGALVGGICNASLFLGANGFLNNIRHTSNTVEQLKAWGGDRYTGEALYQECQAVRDGGVVTANGTAALEFTRECLLGLGVGTPAQVEGFYLFNKRGFYDE